MIAYVSERNRRSKVLNIIICLIIKMATRRLGTRNLPISQIALDGNLQGKIDGKSDLNVIRFMPKFHDEKTISGDIFFTSHIALNKIFCLALTLAILTSDNFGTLTIYRRTSGNFLSRFFRLLRSYDFSIFPCDFSPAINRLLYVGIPYQSHTRHTSLYNFTTYHRYKAYQSHTIPTTYH